MDRIATEFLIIGGGPAGIAAAANSQLETTILDENPFLGGQIWRREINKANPPQMEVLKSRIETQRVQTLSGLSAAGLIQEKTVLATGFGKSTEITFEKLLIATGARERFLPFPGWTLPNVFGAGGLQALVKSGLSVKEKRIIVSGTGPLLLAVANFLIERGAYVILIAEQANRTSLARFALGLLKTPKKLLDGLNMKNQLGPTKYVLDSYAIRAKGENYLKSVEINEGGRISEVECDMLACGFHLVPNIEFAELLGCSIGERRVITNDFCETTVKDVYCAGESSGIGGVELALIEGEIAAHAASGKLKSARRLFRKKRKAERFAQLLEQTFAVRDELKALCSEETIFCRCENVTFDEVCKFSTFRDAKLQTRCGMGSCQGRVCGAAGEFLFGWERASIRPPIYPVKIESLLDIGKIE